MTTIEVGHRLLGVTAGWELFARGPGVLVRIQPAAGRVTRTQVPELRSTGPVSFVVGGNRAIIRPLDFVPGYVVPDGHSARRLRGALGHSGPAFPGPDPSHVWVQPGHGSGAIVSLVGMDGGTTNMSIRIPASSSPIAPDGQGYLLVNGTGGTYQARPGGLRRITTGAVTAVGPTHWLTVECDDRHHCTNVAIDGRDRTRRNLPGPAIEPSRVSLPGMISPDGSTAAVTLRDADTGTLHLIDLTTGAHRSPDEPIEPNPASSSLAWSPDSRWLFLADADQQLIVVDAHTGQARHIDVALPPISQLAVRNNHN